MNNWHQNLKQHKHCVSKYDTQKKSTWSTILFAKAKTLGTNDAEP